MRLVREQSIQAGMALDTPRQGTVGVAAPSESPPLVDPGLRLLGSVWKFLNPADP
jgi:hypothetical protein